MRVGVAAEESQAAQQASGGAREERNGGAGGVEGRQILEEQSILEGSDHVQKLVESVGPIVGRRFVERHRVACGMDLAESTAIFEMEAGSKQ